MTQAHASAQQAFAALLKEHVGPQLRHLGLKGSGGRYRLDIPGMWAQLGFQKSTASTVDTVRFTVNLSVITEADWAEVSHAPGETPAPSVDYGPGWIKRIGSLLPTGHDVWWIVSKNDDLAVVAAPVIEALVGWGVPALRREAARRASE